MEASNTQNNEMEIRFDSRSENEGFARVSVASFLTQLNPTVEEVADVKTAVSEAVTNAIIHGYRKPAFYSRNIGPWKRYCKCGKSNGTDVYNKTGG